MGKGEGKKGKKINLDGITVPKSSSFAGWYSQVIIKAELIDYYDISGCYIFRPWSYQIWEQIQDQFNSRIKGMGVRNAYFPLLVSKRALEAEEDHLEGFSAEVAWVTKSGQSALAEPVALRPTSETIMYPAYSKWIKSHRDLPLRLNQWSNIVRWEFKHPVPFIRSREFLWQEGHSAFATKEEADVEVRDILKEYASVYQDLLAVPVVQGMKSEKEKFAGGDYTTTVEAFIPCNGRAVQGATSHHLGQNFSKMFNIEFETESGSKSLVYQNSWGITTRTIGVMIMVHGDDKGLVLPPRVAPLQAVVVPITFAKNSAEELKALDTAVQSLAQALKAAGVRSLLDNSTNHTPGWKYNHYEVKGVPVRVEMGPRDVASQQCVFVRRDTGEKTAVPVAEAPATLKALLETIHNDMLAKATKERDSHIVQVTDWEKVVPVLDEKNMILAPFCDNPECEEMIKKKTAEISKQEAEKEGEESHKLTGAAKTLCAPFDQPSEIPEGTNCIAHAIGCPTGAKKWYLFGRSY